MEAESNGESTVEAAEMEEIDMEVAMVIVDPQVSVIVLEVVV
jgi:hypothetical protein